MHNCTVLYTLVFFFFADIACKVVVCCASPECCFCLHLIVLISIIAGDYCSPVSTLKCSKQFLLSSIYQHECCTIVFCYLQGEV